MKAMMSDAAARREAQGARHYNGECRYTWCCEDVREAERVLAEAETLDAHRWSGYCHAWPLDTAILGRLQMMDEERDALASAITDVLPVLDEMASDATTDAVNSFRPSDGEALIHIAAFDRNRATLAGMEAGQ